MTPITFLHAFICVFLIIVILIQPGRRGGLTESMAAAESLFGSQTNAFMIKTTTILATFFLVTCLGLAFLSAKQNKSLMSSRVAAQTTPTPETAPAAPSVEAPSAVDASAATQ